MEIFSKTKHCMQWEVRLGCISHPEEDWIPLPEGGSLYELPGRRAIGIDVKTGEMRLCEKGWAVAAFIPPAHTGLSLQHMKQPSEHQHYRCSVTRQLDGKTIHFLFQQCASNKISGRKAVASTMQKFDSGVNHLLKSYPHNRLVKHLAENCCLTYHCPAAQELFYRQMGMSGAILTSLQCKLYRLHFFPTQDETIPSTQDRLTFKPSAEEIVEFTVPHLESAPFPIISFGQGCEGEPLLMWETIRDRY